MRERLFRLTYLRLTSLVLATAIASSGFSQKVVEVNDVEGSPLSESD